ncbi:MAG: N-6 DNA methylase, partial [Acidobacteria bacterium]|nr:N-6 DNA methylase [Acidobacteriota bacterium]
MSRPRTLPDLREATTSFGSELIGLDEFSRILGVEAAVIRGRRERDPDFPAPVREGSSRSAHFLRDLVEWLPEDIDVSIDRFSLRRWTLWAAVARCSSDHGAEATLRLLAGTALLLLHPWGRTARRLPAAELLDAIRTHVAAVEPEHPTLATEIIGFTPDPIPATDRTFLLSLVSWAGRSREPIISTDSSSAALLLDQLRRLWFEGCRPDIRRFIDTVESDIRSLAKDTATRSSTSAHGLNRLLLTIASMQRGEVLLDPACGQGSLFIDAHELLHGGGRVRQKVGFVGREQDLGTWTVAKVRLGLRGIAHDLGEPTDGTRCELAMPSFTHIIADPEVGARGLKVWTRRIVELLDEHGTGQLVVPASLVFPTVDGRGRGAWWKALQPHIDAVVFTPTDAAIILLRRDA